MKERKSVKFNLQQQHQNGHLSPFNLAKLLDPDASWDKLMCTLTTSWDQYYHLLGDGSIKGKSCKTVQVKRVDSTLEVSNLIARREQTRALTFGVSIADAMDQLGDVLHWIRQVVALVCGLLWGSIPLVGGIWIVGGI